MIIKGLLDEDFVQYKKPSMTIMFPICDFKCEQECGEQVCQNGVLATSTDIEVDEYDIVNRYCNNKISKSCVIAGLEPFDSYSQLISFVNKFRFRTDDDIVIYTGYTKRELEDRGYLDYISTLKNIIVKFGRYIPGQEKHYDEVLGVSLASNNQYAEVIS